MSLKTYLFPYNAPDMFLNASPLNLTGDGAGGRAVFDLYVQRCRDAMRIGDGEGQNWNQALGGDWKVSDIARFNGGSNCDVYLFEARNLVLNKSMLFVFVGRNTTSNEMGRDQYVQFGNGTGNVWAQNVVVAPNNSSAMGSAQSFFAVFFNTDVASDDYDMAFTDSVNMTYGTGDFTAPASSNLPWNTATKMNNFLPSHGKNSRGLYCYMPITGNSAYEFEVCINDDASECGVIVLARAGGLPYPFAIFGAGDFAVSVTPGDTYLAVAFWSWYANSSTQYGLIQNSFNGHVDGRTSAGAVKYDWNLVCAESLTFGNRKDGSGNYIWNRMQIIQGANNKGFMSANIMREIGAFNGAQDFLERYDMGGGIVMVKYNETWAIRQGAGIPNFPFKWPGAYLDTP